MSRPPAVVAELHEKTLPSPLGPLRLVFDEGSLHVLSFFAGAESYPPGEPPGDLEERLTSYFAGEVTALQDLPCRTQGTAFQEKVWAALRRIPAGETTTYGALAREVGNPHAARAVGSANHVNPIALVIPCHRVVGSNGRLVGYGGGLEKKRWLLSHEAQHARLPLLSR